MGVISGDMLIDGRPRDASFQRSVGYAPQGDVHLETSTVREALEFSAILRQPADVPRAEKIAYVDEVIELLDMQAYAGAVVGVPGEGEQHVAIKEPWLKILPLPRRTERRAAQTSHYRC